MSPFGAFANLDHVRIYSVPDLDQLHAYKHIVEVQVQAHQSRDDAFDGKMVDSISPADVRFTASRDRHAPLMHGDQFGTQRRGAFMHKLLSDR